MDTEKKPGKKGIEESKAGNQGENGVKMSMTVKLMAISLIPIIILGFVVVSYADKNITGGMQERTMNGLENTAYAIEAAYDAVAPGEYSIGADGDLYKGEYNVSENYTLIDSLCEKSEIVATVFYGDTRMVTSIIDEATNKRITGTKASDKVVQTVLNDGEVYTDTSVDINGDGYYVCYVPLENEDGEIIGMVFAGETDEYVNSYIKQRETRLIAVALIFILFIAVIQIIFARSMSKAIKNATKVVVELSRGDLTVLIDEKSASRNDEIGLMSREVNEFIEKIHGIFRNLKKLSAYLSNVGNEMTEMADKTGTTATQVNHMVGEIAKGAVSQAGQLESATVQVVNMGDEIGHIVENMNSLDGTSMNMKNAGDTSSVIIEELTKSNDRTNEAFAKIESQVSETAQSVHDIKQAIQSITEIASQTNILSVNASIEAARAGEAGRGFSVVAGEVQKLASETDASANVIMEVLEKLSYDSDKTVQIMKQVQEIIEDQQKKLNETRNQFAQVNEGINLSRDGITVVKGKSADCDTSRGEVIQVISNLAAISQENAASAEETTSVMNELSEEMQKITHTAKVVKKSAGMLQSDVDLFII